MCATRLSPSSLVLGSRETCNTRLLTSRCVAVRGMSENNTGKATRTPLTQTAVYPPTQLNVSFSSSGCGKCQPRSVAYARDACRLTDHTHTRPLPHAPTIHRGVDQRRKRVSEKYAATLDSIIKKWEQRVSATHSKHRLAFAPTHTRRFIFACWGCVPSTIPDFRMWTLTRLINPLDSRGSGRLLKSVGIT
jgi:hypothetical protein